MSMSAVTGSIGSFKALRKHIEAMPTVLGQRMAKRAARVLTGAAQVDFDSFRTVYGDARPTSDAREFYSRKKYNYAWRKARWGKGKPKGGGSGRRRGSYAEGGRLNLRETGATRSDVYFVAIGTLVRAQLGPKYAKYLIGKYKILPSQGPLPSRWSEALGRNMREVADAYWAEVGE